MRFLDLIRKFLKKLLHMDNKNNVYEHTVTDNTLYSEEKPSNVPQAVQHNDYEILYGLVLDELKKKYESKEINGVLYFYKNDKICAFDDNGILCLYLDISSDILWHHDAVMLSIINDIKTDSGPLDAIHIMPMMGALQAVGVVDGKYRPKHFPYYAQEESKKRYCNSCDKDVSTCGNLFLDESGHFNAFLLGGYLLKNTLSVDHVRKPNSDDYIKNLSDYSSLLSHEGKFKSFSLAMHCDSSEYSDDLFHFLSDLFDEKKYNLSGLELERQPLLENYTYLNGVQYVQSDSESLYIFLLAELKERYNLQNIDGKLVCRDENGRICAIDDGRNLKIYLEARSYKSSYIYELSITNDMRLCETISDTVSITRVLENVENIAPSGRMFKGTIDGTILAELFGSITIDNIYPSEGEIQTTNILGVNANIPLPQVTQQTMETHSDAQTYMVYPDDTAGQKGKKHR